MSKKEQAAVADYVSREYDSLVFQEQNSYVSLNAQSDSDGWQERLREQIACDAGRVRVIIGTNSPAPGGKAGGFTLIELSIVLVVIGLVVGGVLVGRDLIKAAEVRAQVTQIEKFNSAANTFLGKYGYLPGDIKDPIASSFGFVARGQYAGEGDGNGVIEGITSDASGMNSGNIISMGETALFWVDLSTAGLIEGGFNTATATSQGAGGCCVSGTSIAKFLPTAAIGGGNYIYVWAGSYHQTGNYFGISAITSLLTLGALSSNTVPVRQAYAIDSKMDDGLPQSGNITARFARDPHDDASVWAGSPVANGTFAPYTTATAGASTTCFDNNSTSGATQQYSVEISNGANPNCALSFKMQAGD